MLENVIGDNTTQLYATEGHPLYVWSCWMPNNLPSNLDQLLEWAVVSETKEELRAKWVCPKDTEPQQTGTTKSLDAK